MNNETIFTAKKKHLDLLDEDTAVEFFTKLLWAEANRLGPGTCKINVPSETKIPDGGIDATVDADLLAKQSDIIAPGKNGYQIRSGTAFKPWRDGDVRKELFKKGTPKTPEKENLRESTKDCLDERGIYVLVCTGIDCLVPPNRKKASKLIKDYLETCGYPKAKVEVWAQNTLIRFLQLFPSLSLWVNGRNSAKFQTHDSWSRDASMQRPFVHGESQDELIENLRSDLRRADNKDPMLVSGRPGIGKTRLVLEATNATDLAPLVIYAPADQFLQDKFLMDELCNDENDYSAIVVIDDCNLHSRSEILDKLKYRSPKIRLITIYNNHEEAAGDISPYVPQRLSDDQISNIIKQHTKAPDLGDRRWVELCNGSPRVAHVVGWNLANYPKDALAPLSTVNTWERYIVPVDHPSQERTEQRRRVLRYMALFKQFGFENPVGEDAEAVSKKIEEADPQITWTIFQEIVDNLKKRKILDGDYTLAITPKALQIKLWTEWWDIYGRTFDLDEFIKDFPCESKLIEWFYEMFSYASRSGVALSAVKDLLGPDGPFQQQNYLQTSHGGPFFLALTEADPKSALECLKKTVRTCDGETLSQFVEGTYVVLALEKIAVWKEHFADAAELLLALGEGKFAEFFSPAPGGVAPTEASPKERFPILQGAIDSESKAQRSLALKACDVALESSEFSRFGSPEYQGLRQKPKLWEPKTYGQFLDALRKVWKLLEERLRCLPEDERKEGATILIGRAREIGRIPALAGMVVETVGTIVKERYVSERHVVETVKQILHYDGSDIPAKTLELWEQLMDKLVTPDFQFMMKRYVGMALLEDEFDEDGNQVDRAQPHIEELAKRALDNAILLQSELDWLVTTEAQKGYYFGRELAKRDDGFSLLPMLLDAQRNAGENASTAFLGGYYSALFESDTGLWETQLDALIDDAKLRLLLPELTNRSGLTDRAGLRILDLAERDIIDISQFRFFAYGQQINNLSDKVFTEWMTFLLRVTDKTSVSLAVNLFHRYHVFQKTEPTLPFELTFRLITHPALFKETDGSRVDSTMRDYYWTEISKAFLQLEPEKKLKLATLMLSHFGEKGSIVNPYSRTCSMLDEITEKCPAEIWKQVSRLLENHEYSSKKFALEQWLREGSSWGREETKPALLRIPHELIWDWIGEDTENRAWYFAERVVPKTYSVKKWKASLVREFLVRYGSQEEIKHSLMSNYLSGVSFGPASSHLQAKKEKLLQIRDIEDDDNVNRWIDEFVAGLEAQSGRERMREERVH